MKKKIFAVVAVLAFAAVIGLNVRTNSQENKMADLSLDNVEALAGGEYRDLEGLLCGAWCQIYFGYECNVMTPDWWLRCVDYNKK